MPCSDHSSPSSCTSLDNAESCMWCGPVTQNSQDGCCVAAGYTDECSCGSMTWTGGGVAGLVVGVLAFTIILCLIRRCCCIGRGTSLMSWWGRSRPNNRSTSTNQASGNNNLQQRYTVIAAADTDSYQPILAASAVPVVVSGAPVVSYGTNAAPIGQVVVGDVHLQRNDPSDAPPIGYSRV